MDELFGFAALPSLKCARYFCILPPCKKRARYFRVLPPCKKCARYFRVLPPCRTGKISFSLRSEILLLIPVDWPHGAQLKTYRAYFQDRAAKRTQQRAMTAKPHCTLIVLSNLIKILKTLLQCAVLRIIL